MAIRMSELAHPLVPSLQRSRRVTVTVDRQIPPGASAVGVAVGVEGDVPTPIGLDRAVLRSAGFTGERGTTLVLPSTSAAPTVAIGVGDADELDAAALRDAAASFALAASTHAHLAISVLETTIDPAVAAQALVEGVLLARYRYEPLRNETKTVDVDSISIVVADSSASAAAEAGARRGHICATATLVARDLANAPHNHMTATDLAEIAESIAAECGLGIEVYDKDDLLSMGCGGLLGVNAGSVEPPRMIKLTYVPPTTPTGRLTLVGKGIMYDSGGIALKPGDEMHSQMKNDMSGAGAVLTSMAALSELGCTTAVTGYLMCTDNMPSGTAMALGDVITIRGGRTVEVVNTDAEGRLVMADALVLGTEEPTDAIIDIATLTGACMRALGTRVAGLLGNDDGLMRQIEAAGRSADEPVWRLPLERRYRPELDSHVADIRNLGGANAGAITAALFLEEFVDGRPWAHIDIAGTASNATAATWRTVGCTGFGARLLIDLMTQFVPPEPHPS